METFTYSRSSNTQLNWTGAGGFLFTATVVFSGSTPTGMNITANGTTILFNRTTSANSPTPVASQPSDRLPSIRVYNASGATLTVSSASSTQITFSQYTFGISSPSVSGTFNVNYNPSTGILSIQTVITTFNGYELKYIPSADIFELTDLNNRNNVWRYR
jgi:hypothetical protein